MLKRSAVYGAATVLGAVAVLLVLALYFVALPRITAAVTRAQLQQLEKRLEIELEFSSAALSRRHGLVLNDLRATTIAGDVTITADSARVRADLLRLLLGRREIRRLELRGIGVQASNDHGELTLRADRMLTDGLGRAELGSLLLDAPRINARLYHETPRQWLSVELKNGRERGESPGHEPQHRDDTSLDRNLARLVEQLPLPGELVVTDGVLHLEHGNAGPGDRLRPRTPSLTLAELSLVVNKPTRTAGGRLETSGEIAVAGLPAGSWVVELGHSRREVLPTGAIELRGLDIGALGGVLGPSEPSGSHRGLLSAELTTARGRRRSETRFNGRLELEDAAFQLSQIARESFELPSFSYAFEGFLDPDAPAPEPRLLHATPGHGSPDGSPPLSQPAGSADGSRGSLVTERGRARLGGVEFEAALSLHGLHGFTAVPDRLEFSVDLPSTPAQELLDAVPRALSGELSRMRLGGEFGLRFELELPSAHPSAMRRHAEPEFRRFEVREMPSELDVFRLNEAFTHRIVDESVGFDRTVEIPAPKPVSDDWLRRTAGLTEREIASKQIRGVLLGPRTTERAPGLFDDFNAGKRLSAFSETGLPIPTQPQAGQENESCRYMRLEQLSDRFVRSVITAEDHYFFWHTGINWPALKHAVERNLEARAYRLGASTISMQLAKNLFLTHDRVAARKLQELFLVYLMEHVARVPKERILEIYLNVIEFGPGIFGVAQAAQHYFETEPSRLGLLDSVWLSALLPNPKHYHDLFHRGDGSEAWSSRTDYQLELLRTRGRISEEEYQRARAKLDSYTPRTSASQAASAASSSSAGEDPAGLNTPLNTPLETTLEAESTLRQFLPPPRLPELSNPDEW